MQQDLITPIAKVLIVDDHRTVREGVRALLATEPTLRVVGEAVTGDEALGLALVFRPDLIVLDQEMPGSSGLDILRKLRVILPASGVVMFTMSTAISGEARLRGADAVVAKDDPAGLVAALRRSAADRAGREPSAEPRRASAVGRGGWWRIGRARVVIVAGLAVLYVASFLPLLGWFGTHTLDLAILVVAAAGAVYGLRGGLVAAALAPVVNALLVGEAGIDAGLPSVPHVLIGIVIGAAFGWLRDVTVRADTQARSLADASAALEASDRRLLGLIEDAPVLLVSIDAAGVIVDALGSEFEDHPRFSPERMRGQQLASLYADNPELLARVSRALAGEEVHERVERYGFVYDTHVRPRRDAAGAIVGATAVLVNVSGRVRAEQRLERASLQDRLTGLPNRLLLQDRVEQALRAARRGRGGVGALVLGLDDFKVVNNTHGHSVGDILLREVAARLRARIRDADTLARFGGDEFAIVPGGPPAGGIAALAGTLRQAFTEPFIVAERRLHVGVSIGSALHPEDGDDAQTLLRRAEIAMYDAKRSRAGYAPYRADMMDEPGADRMTLMTELREALERGGLELYYQPVVAVPGGELVMAEALLRWHHPTRGEIPPLEFIPMAEETDLMGPLTGWVLTRAVDQCRRWVDAGLHVPVAVNLSVRNLVDDGLAERIRALLEAASLPADHLTVEITESVVMADAARSLLTMRQLRAAGIEIAIDDFGTGYSSLAYLGRLPISAVKIDRTFVGSLLTDPSSLAIVGATVGLAHALGLKMVAEGVESQVVLDRLHDLGSDRAQGYFIARPMPADAFLAWLERTAAHGSVTPRMMIPS